MPVSYSLGDDRLDVWRDFQCKVQYTALHGAFADVVVVGKMAGRWGTDR
jgi:hypothetical protein